MYGAFRASTSAASLAHSQPKLARVADSPPPLTHSHRTHDHTYLKDLPESEALLKKKKQYVSPHNQVVWIHVEFRL